MIFWIYIFISSSIHAIHIHLYSRITSHGFRVHSFFWQHFLQEKVWLSSWPYSYCWFCNQVNCTMWAMWAACLFYFEEDQWYREGTHWWCRCLYARLPAALRQRSNCCWSCQNCFGITEDQIVTQACHMRFMAYVMLMESWWCCSIREEHPPLVSLSSSHTKSYVAGTGLIFELCELEIWCLCQAIVSEEKDLDCKRNFIQIAGYLNGFSCCCIL